MNLEWAKKWMSSYNRNGLDKLFQLYADDIKFEDVITGDKANGKDQFKEALTGFLAAPGPGENMFTVTAYTGNADAGAAEWTWNAKHAGEFMGVPADGKETQVKGVSILTFRGGKISSQRDYWDSASVFRQLGALK